MRRSIIASLAALLCVGLVAGCAGGGSGGSSEFAGTRLDQPYRAPDIELTDTSGEPYSLVDDTDKPVTLVFFGYTHCPDLCKLVMGSLGAAMNRLEKDDRERVDLVFITTDPARDDEQVLREYLDGYGEGFIGLTGRLDTIVEVAEPLHVYVNDGKKLPSGGYDLGGHSTTVLGIDEHDRAVALWGQETSAAQYASDIETLLSDD